MLTKETLVEFMLRCEECVTSGSDLSFTGYHAERSEYHGELSTWGKNIDAVVELVQSEIDTWNECETLLEKQQLVAELVEDCMPYDECQTWGDSDTAYFDTDHYKWNDTELPQKADQFSGTGDTIVFCELYPYRYGTYSGTVDLVSLEFSEFCVDGDHSPCGGPDDTWVKVPANAITLIETKLQSL